MGGEQGTRRERVRGDSRRSGFAVRPDWLRMRSGWGGGVYEEQYSHPRGGEEEAESVRNKWERDFFLGRAGGDILC
jgi:hypothetical protein